MALIYNFLRQFLEDKWRNIFEESKSANMEALYKKNFVFTS